MGELSKEIGEHGEKIALGFFKKIGWKNPSTGEVLQCNRKAKHKTPTAKKDRSTHGIDLFFSYKSNLEDFSVENILASVKFTDKPYPKSPLSLFKSHYEDLSETLECFSESDLRDSNNADYEELGINRSNDTGVLIWLSNNKETDPDLINKINRVNLEKKNDFNSIQVLDNARVEFIHDAITSVEVEFLGHDIYFHYSFNASNSIDPSIKKYGRVFPVEYLTSPIIPMRVVDSTTKKQKFVIVTKERYSEDCMKALLSFASNTSLEFSNEFVFFFPDYDDLNHKKSVQSCIKSINKNSDTSIEVSVFCINPGFRGLLNAK